MKSIGTNWTILVGDHPGIIPFDFSLIPISIIEGEFFPRGITWKKMVEDL